ncbi:type II secretion system protein J [Chloroflexota bacterium]
MKQRGFTLIEILVVMAVGGMILAGVVLSIQQIFLSTARSNSQVTALADIDRVVLSIKKDLLMTQSTNLTDGDPTPQSSVTLTWIDYTSSFSSSNQTSHSSSYILSDTELQRTYDSTMNIVGRHITSIGFTQSGKVIKVTITATGPTFPYESRTLTFSSHIRAEEVE